MRNWFSQIPQKSFLQRKTGIGMRLAFAMMIFFFATLRSSATVYTWVGTTTAWATSTNWSPNGVPGSAPGDDVLIAGTVNIVLSATPANPLSSLTFTGSGRSLTINNGAVLTVTGAVILNSLTTGNMTGTLTATAGGILNCGSLQIGSGGGGTATRTTTLTVSILIINITGDFTFNSSYSTAANNTTLTHTSGTINVNGTVTTTNANGANISTYNMGTTSPRLNLVNATPFSVSGTGTSTFSFNNTGATVDYQAASNITLPSAPAGLLAYRNLVISGGGGNVKTLGANTTLSGASSTLTIAAGTTLDISSFTLNTVAITMNNVTGGDGATLTGTGQLVLGGNVSVTQPGGAGTINTGCMIAAPVQLTGNRTMTLASDGSAAVELTISGQITSTGFGIIKATAGSSLLLTGDNSGMTGNSTLTAGNLVLGNVAALGPAGQSIILTVGILDLATDAPVNVYNVTTTGTSGSLTIASNKATAASAGITHNFGNLTTGRTIIVTGGSNASSGNADINFTGNVLLSNNAAFTVNNSAVGATTQLTLDDMDTNGFTMTIAGTGTTVQTDVWSGNGGITKSGTGTLTLSEANTYSGLTTLSGGILTVAHTAGMGAAGQTVWLTSGTLNLATNSSVNAYNLSTTGTTAVTVSSNRETADAGITHILGDLSLNARTVTYSSGANVTSGTAGITFSGTVTLNGNAVFTVNNGVSNAMHVTVGNVDNNGATASVGGTGTLEQSASGVWSGGGGITKTSSGTLMLAGTNTYTGLTTLSAGNLNITNIAGAGPAGNTLLLNGGVLNLLTDASVNEYALTSADNDALMIVSDRATPGAGITHNFSSFTSSIGKTVTFTGGTNATSGITGISFSGLLSYTGTHVFNINNATGTTALVTVNSVNNNGALATVGGTGDMLQAGGVWSGGGGITRSGTGTLSLNGSNTYTGTTTITSGAVVVGNIAGMGPSANAVTLTNATLDLSTDASVNAYNVTVNGSGTIVSNKATNATAGITHSLGTLSIGAQTLIITAGTNVASGIAGVAFSTTTFTQAPIFTINNGAGASALFSVAAVNNGTRTATINGDGDMIQTGVWGNGSGGITKNSTGYLTLDQPNTFTGAVNLNGGVLNINNATALGVGGTFNIAGGNLGNTSGSDIVSNNHAVNWNADFSYNSPNSLDIGSGAINFISDVVANITNGTLIAGGTLSEAGFSLTKAGNGTLAFGSQTITLRNLTITAGTFSSTSGTLALAGNFVNNGSFVHNDGTVNFNGTAEQNIDGADFYNLTVSGNKGGNATTFSSGANIGIAAAFSRTATNTSYIITGTTFNFNGTIAQTVPAMDYHNLSFSSDRSGGAITLSSGSIGIYNAFTVTATNTTYVLTGNTVDFNGPGTQTIPSFTFNLLVISNSGVKRILSSGNVTAVSLTINGAATMEAEDNSMLTLTL